jgi:hypothetical protein
MSLGVGYPASIVAQMLARREIAQAGLLNPLLHVPDGRFLEELAKRGITVSETVTWEDEADVLTEIAAGRSRATGKKGPNGLDEPTTNNDNQGGTRQ